MNRYLLFINIRDYFYKYLIFFVSFLLIILLFSGFFIYNGDILILSVFYTSFIAILLLSLFSFKSYFFGTLSLFLTLAFPIKIGLMLLGGLKFFEPVGNFSYSTTSFDRLLLTTTIGILGLILSKLLFLKKNKNLEIYSENKIINKSTNIKIIIELMFFTASVLILSFFNFKYHIFQVGVLSKNIFPFGINKLFFFGFNALFPIWLCSILNKLNIDIIFKVFIICFISLIISITLLSRGVFLMTAFPLVIVAIYSLNVSLLKWKKFFSISSIFLASLIISLLAVSYLRAELYSGSTEFKIKNQQFNEINRNYEILGQALGISPAILPAHQQEETVLKGNPSEYIGQISSLFVNRWVGPEGVATSIDSPFAGLTIFKKAIVEPSTTASYGIYQILANSPFARDNFSFLYGYSFGVLPGFIGFFALSNSLVIVFIATFLMSFAMISLEKIFFFKIIKNSYLRFWFSVSIANSIVQFSQPIAWAKWFSPLIFCVLFIFISSRIRNHFLCKKSY